MKKPFSVLAIFFLLITIIPIQAQDVVDNSTLNNKIMAGYQGWFGAPNDGSGHGWIHWSRGETPAPDNITFDMWPDMREYDEDELFPTSFYYADGRNAGLYSAYTTKTVDRHVKWMKDYGIHGVFVQRFISSALARREQRDKVLDNVRLGAEKYGRVFANMYDMSGGRPGQFVQDVIDDWKHLVDDLKITESPNYLHHNGRPVLSLWGVHVGNSGDDLSAADWKTLVTWLTEGAEEKYLVTLKAGVGNGWRTDTQEWQEVYDAFDFISPWAVGRYRDNNSADNYRNTYFQVDLNETASRGMEYIPVVFPGFSWKNLKGEGNALNSIPRNGGDFLWHQFYNAIDAGCNMVYVAMFDEVDEGTAIYKVTENATQTPTTGDFLTLDADGQELPSDWYLRLTGEATKMLRGEIALTSQIPISPYPNTAKFISQEIITQMTPGSSATISVTMENVGTTTWTKAGGYKLGSADPEDNLTWGLSRVEMADGEAIAPGETKTFTFDITAPTEANVYRLQWKMVQEGDAYFGEKSKLTLVNVGSSSFFLDDCDVSSGWSSSNSLSLNTLDNKQGAGCLERSGSGTDEFRKTFSPAYNAQIAADDALLQFWYYTSDASKMSSSNQVEIGSGGTHDVNEYHWTLKDLQTGWNLISLRISDAAKDGSPNLNAINWFRLYNIKSGSVITRIDEIQILDINASIPKYDLTVNGGQGDGSYVEGTNVTIQADPPNDGYTFANWEIISGSAIIIEAGLPGTTLIMGTENVEISASYKPLGIYLDDCDKLTGWNSAGALTLNTIEQKEGAGCVEFSGLGTDEYSKAFTSSYRAGVTPDKAVLRFWYYTSDANAMGTNNQVEIGSAGRPDQEEYNWNLSGLTTGWNLIELPVSTASESGGTPDLNAINWFRIYNFKSAAVTTRIDAIEIIDPGAGEKHLLLVNQGNGTGAYYQGTQIAITADTPNTGKTFDKWVINSGNPNLADLNASNTTLTMPGSDAEVTAVYKDVPFYTLTVENGSGDGSYEAGQSVQIIADELEGQEFVEWVIKSGSTTIENSSEPVTNLTMETEDVVVAATYNSIVLSIEDLSSLKQLSVYPNPTDEDLHINLILDNPSPVELRLLDLSGRIVGANKGPVTLGSGEHKMDLRVAEIKSGTYLLRVQIGNMIITRSVIIH